MKLLKLSLLLAGILTLAGCENPTAVFLHLQQEHGTTEVVPLPHNGYLIRRTNGDVHYVNAVYASNSDSVVVHSNRRVFEGRACVRP